MCTNQPNLPRLKKPHLEMLCTVTHCTGHILAIVENVHDKPGCMLVDSQLVSWSVTTCVVTHLCYKLPYLLLSVQAMVLHGLDRKPNLGTVGCNISGNEIGQTLGFSFCARQHTHDSNRPTNSHSATMLHS